jgi:hypothetical protein
VNISTTNLSSVNISTTNFLTKKLIVDNTNLTINPQIFTDTIYSTKINTTLYTQKPSGTIILGNNINTTIPKLISNNMSLTNKILGNITKINSINVNVNNNVEYLETQKFYFNSTTKNMITTAPTSNNVTDFVLNFANGIGTFTLLIGKYTFTSNPFINFNNNQVIIELDAFTSMTNTGFGSEVFFEIYKNNVYLLTARQSYPITDTTNNDDPYICILEANIGNSTINDVFSINLYFRRYNDGINAITGRINLDKSFITIMNTHSKGYLFIERNRKWSDDVVLNNYTDYNLAYSFNITKGCWIIELSLTFNVVSTGVHAFYIRIKDLSTSLFINNTLYYWGTLTSTGGNHTVKTRQIITTYTNYTPIEPFIFWINVGSTGSNITMRGANTIPNYIRYIKIG